MKTEILLSPIHPTTSKTQSTNSYIKIHFGPSHEQLNTNFTILNNNFTNWNTHGTNHQQQHLITTTTTINHEFINILTTTTSYFINFE